MKGIEDIKIAVITVEIPIIHKNLSVEQRIIKARIENKIEIISSDVKQVEIFQDVNQAPDVRYLKIMKVIKCTQENVVNMAAMMIDIVATVIEMLDVVSTLSITATRVLVGIHALIVKRVLDTIHAMIKDDLRLELKALEEILLLRQRNLCYQ